jgi:hypothetical protein
MLLLRLPFQCYCAPSNHYCCELDAELSSKSGCWTMYTEMAGPFPRKENYVFFWNLWINELLRLVTSKLPKVLFSRVITKKDNPEGKLRSHETVQKWKVCRTIAGKRDISKKNRLEGHYVQKKPVRRDQSEKPLLTKENSQEGAAWRAPMMKRNYHRE